AHGGALPPAVLARHADQVPGVPVEALQGGDGPRVELVERGGGTSGGAPAGSRRRGAARGGEGPEGERGGGGAQGARPRGPAGRLRGAGHGGTSRLVRGQDPRDSNRRRGLGQACPREGPSSLQQG